MHNNRALCKSNFVKKVITLLNVEQNEYTKDRGSMNQDRTVGRLRFMYGETQRSVSVAYSISAARY